MQFALFIIALCPIIWLVIGLSGLKLSAHIATPISLLIAFVLSLVVWHKTPIDMLTGGLEGVAMALWPICWVIVAAIFTYNLTVHTGKMEDIKGMLTSVSPDKRVLVLIIAWGFGCFLEGMAGFGTAVAIPASMLWALGFNPLTAAAICLVADTVPVAFGSVGIPVTTLSQVTGIKGAALANGSSIQLFLFGIIVPFVLVIMVGKSVKALKGVGLLTLLSAVSYTVPQFLIAKVSGEALPAIIGSVCTMAVTIIGARRVSKKLAVKYPEYEVELEGSSGTATASAAEGGAASGAAPQAAATAAVAKKKPLTLGGAINAWLPFLLIFILLTVTSLIPPIHQALATIKTSVKIYTGSNAAAYTFTWIGVPGTMIMISAFIGGLAQGANFGEILGVLGRTVKQLTRTIITVVSVLALAKIMGYAGMVSAIATMLVIMTGTFYPLIAPLIGSLGTFITGSATSSSVLFGKLQTSAASQLHLNESKTVWLAAANATGATAGKIISVQSIATAVAATSLVGQDGKLFSKVMKYYIGYIIIAGVIVFAGMNIFA